MKYKHEQRLIGLPDDINSSNDHKTYHDIAIDILSRCDGETAQFIVEQSLQKEQLLSQLVGRRLQFIQEDIEDIDAWLKEKGIDKTEMGSKGVGMNTYLGNIEASIDLDSDETDGWMLRGEAKKSRG